jgi:hypothetical protein
MEMINILFWPFALAFAGVMIIFKIIFLIVWVVMIVDCAKRKFNVDWEKFLWLGILVFFNWIGIILYFIVVRSMNPRGVIRN